VHRPGKKHVNADVLLQHAAATVNKLPDLSQEVATDIKLMKGLSLTKEIILQAQTKDEFCQQVYQALLEGKTLPYFRDQDLVLYRRSSGPSEGAKLVVPAVVYLESCGPRTTSYIPATPTSPYKQPFTSRRVGILP
jgi:RNase P subunit RPR2